MAKKYQFMKFSFWLMWIPTLLVMIALGGTFVSGFFTDKIILSLIPLMVHQLIGWIMILGVIIAFIVALFKKK